MKIIEKFEDIVFPISVNRDALPEIDVQDSEGNIVESELVAYILENKVPYISKLL